MFCLRSWIPILFFLTNASPVYLILFISAAYVLNRPCVYCSLLLAILVLALFDFSGTAAGGWFELRHETQTQTAPLGDGNATAGATKHGVAPVAMSAVEEALAMATGTVGAAAGAAVDTLVALGRRGLEDGASSWMGWARRAWRTGLRVDCLGITIRL